MPKLKLQPDPTFKAIVTIPVAGSPNASVEFVFKHRDRAELLKCIAASGERSDTDTIMEIASGWELADAFTRENVTLLVENYIAAGLSVWDKYLDELARARIKN